MMYMAVWMMKTAVKSCLPTMSIQITLMLSLHIQPLRRPDIHSSAGKFAEATAVLYTNMDRNLLFTLKTLFVQVVRM